MYEPRKNFEFLKHAVYAPRKNLEKRTSWNFDDLLVQKIANKSYLFVKFVVKIIIGVWHETFFTA